MPGILEQIAGVLLVAAVVLDVFLTVLYARIGSSGVARFGTGVISEHVARLTWRGFRKGAPAFGHRRDDFLSFAGSVIIVFIIVAWIGLLVVGSAMIVHPHLGGAITSTIGRTPTDFVTAIYVVSAALSTAGPTDFTANTAPFRLILGADPFLGMSVLSLTITYLMQVYSALQRRNTMALKIKMLAGGTADAAELIAGIGWENRFTTCYSTLAELGAEVTNLKETHQFYPVLFYFRYREPCYATSRFSLVLFDMISLLQSIVSGESDWIKRTAATKQVWLQGAFISEGEATAQHDVRADERERWRRRYAAAVRRLREARIDTVTDEDTGFAEYCSLRMRWQSHIETLARFMAYDLADIDPEGCRPPVA
jgi:hypothetical protein